MCSKLPFSLKHFPHSIHENGFSPLFPHCIHLNGFSPVCVCLCILRCPLRLKLFPHSIHLNGFSPVCIETEALSTLHTFKLVSPLCESVDVSKFSIITKAFPTLLHLYGFLLCVSPLMCTECPL
uniref:Uncharacterized protein n=1 Tax=Podarcis muralis TaxID=64176 RepID=A0A670JXC7_PODMU